MKNLNPDVIGLSRKIFCLISLLLIAMPSYAADGFITFDKKIQTGASEVEVIEFFSYSCGHCYKLEPFIDEWLQTKPEYIRFHRVPGNLGKKSRGQTRAFYTAKALGVEEIIHSPFFSAIHQDKRGLLGSQNIREFFVEQGVDGGEFDKVYHSNQVSENVRFADYLWKKYGLKGVPAFIIADQYGTSIEIAGGYRQVFEIINDLSQRLIDENKK